MTMLWLGMKRYNISSAGTQTEIELHALVKKYYGMYGQPLGWGSTRFTFDRGDGYVIKVAWNEYGMLSNSREANHNDPYIPLARCQLELDSDGRYYILVMERIDTCMKRINLLPDWVNYVDCCQVGYTQTGELVAYDL